MSPSEFLQAVTFGTAHFLEIVGREGSIEPGKLADLMLVEADPTADLKAMDSVRRVLLNNQWITIEPLPAFRYATFKPTSPTFAIREFSS